MLGSPTWENSTAWYRKTLQNSLQWWQCEYSIYLYNYQSGKNYILLSANEDCFTLCSDLREQIRGSDLISLYIYLFLYISSIYYSKKMHTVKVSVPTEVNIRRVIITLGKCRVAQGRQVLLDSLIHWVILRAKVLIYNE